MKSKENWVQRQNEKLIQINSEYIPIQYFHLKFTIQKTFM